MPTGTYTRTPQHIERIKLGLANPEVRVKLSLGRRGKAPWNKGLTVADPRVAKYSAGHSERMKGKTPWNKGKKGLQTWSEHQREVMSGMPKGESHPQFTGTNVTRFKKLVKVRDNYTCAICELRDEEIMQVDHILPVSTHPHLECDMGNMRVLCPNCHARKSAKEKRKGNHGLA